MLSLNEKDLIMDVKIIVATHKKYKMPLDELYFPIHVGKEGKDSLGYIGDNTGDNISVKNPRFCELTGIYWAWKNLSFDYVGFVHYRRYFTYSKKMMRLFSKRKMNMIATKSQIEETLKDTDVIVPNKRRYYIETIESHFLHLPYTFEKDYHILKSVIKEKSPDYYNFFCEVMHGKSAHMFNMFIMKKDLFNKYCEWLFDILFEVDKRIDVTGYNMMQSRVIGYYSEFLLDVWIKKNGIKYKEVDVLFMEKQNWLVKGGLFLLRKIRSVNK